MLGVFLRAECTHIRTCMTPEREPQTVMWCKLCFLSEAVLLEALVLQASHLQALPLQALFAQALPLQALLLQALLSQALLLQAFYWDPSWDPMGTGICEPGKNMCLLNVF